MKFMKKLYFIRHGLTEMNVLGLRAGSTETPLTAEGRLQAKKAGKKVKALKIDLIVSSSQGRAVETANIIAEQISYPLSKIQTNDILIERHLGEAEGQKYHPHTDVEKVAGVEPATAIIERASQSLIWLNTLPAQNILIVSHGSFGRAMRSLLQPEYQFNDPEPILNAQIIRWL